MHLDAELQNIDNAPSDSENSTHEENEKFPDGDMHDNSDIEQNNMEIRKEPILAKYVRRHHPKEQIIGDKEAKPMTRSRLRSEICLLKKVETITINKALQDNDLYNAMKEEIEQIEKNKTWTLVPRLADKNVIGTKWVFRNKLDANGEITRNKEKLVYKGYA